eukprot:m.34522 g.34522  ORF g.34522 m.34522 type:complete len:220 (-) comp16988_c0_seq1:100-759(-)
MPKSKRQKVVSLTKTGTHQGLQAKEGIIEEIRTALDTYKGVYIFSVQDMRNSQLKDVRMEWRTSRFFLAKTKIMAVALGRTAEEEHMPGLHKLSMHLTGSTGLFFTNTEHSQVTKWFKDYSEPEFARAGNKATETVTLKAGSLSQFSHAIEPHLRKLGMPTTLKRGIVTLDNDYTICTKDSTLTPEQCQMLKLIGTKMAAFAIKLLHTWSETDCVQTLA